MLSLALIPACSFFNRIRGGLFPNFTGGRIFAAIAIGIACGLVAWNPIIAGAVGLGYYLWALPGWGLYFAAATGQWRKDEVEVAFIDWIGLKLVPFITASTNWSNYRRGIICMGLRGGIFSFPLFLALGYLVSPAALYVWPAFFLQGVNYYIAGKLVPIGNPIGLAEWLWGACIGVMLAVVFWQY